MNPFSYKTFACAILAFISLPVIGFSQDTKKYVSSDKIFIVTYPADWKVNKDRRFEFVVYQPGTGMFPAQVSIEIKKKAAGYENADIHQISDVELKMMKAEQNTSLEILDSRFQQQNGHEWWVVKGKSKVLGKEYFSDTYKTIHNGKVYIFSYQSNEKNYEKNKAAADNIIASVEFLTKNDEGVVSTKSDANTTNNTISIQSQNTQIFTDPEKLFTARLPLEWQNEMQSKSNKFSLHPAGSDEKKIVLQAEALPDIVSDMTLKEWSEGALGELKKDAKKGKAVINNNSYVTINGTEWFMIDFSDKTARNIIYLTILDKKKYRFFYTAPLNEYDKDIVTANAVINSVQFGRGVENLTGNESGPDTKNIASNISSGSKINNANPVQKDNNNPSAVIESQSSNTIVTQEKTFQDFLKVDFKNEAEYIKKYGSGKVRRMSEHEIEFTLTGGKKFVLKDPYDAPMKSYEKLGIFIGYSDELNKFMLATEDGHLFGVDRATGRYQGLDLNIYTLKNGSWSPDRKWLAICDGGWDEEGNASISVFSGQFPYKKQYSKNISESGMGWIAGESKWLDNNTLEIPKKNSRDFKPIGSTWLTLQNGKWVQVNTKPVIKANSARENSTTTVQTEKPVFETDHTVQAPNNNAANNTTANQGNTAQASVAGSIAKDVSYVDTWSGLPFTDGYLAVINKNGCSIANAKGEILLPYNKYCVLGFSNGFAVAQDPKNGGKFGYIDKNLKPTGAFSFTEALAVLSDGFAIVEEGGNKDNPPKVAYTVKTYSYSPSTGKKYLLGYRTGHYWVDDQVSYDNNGNKNFSSSGSCKEGLSTFSWRKNDNTTFFGYKDITGKIVIKTEYIEASDFSEGLAVTAKILPDGKKKYGFINKKGETVIPFQYTNKPGDFLGGLALISMVDQSEFSEALINREGEIVLKLGGGSKIYLSNYNTFEYSPIKSYGADNYQYYKEQWKDRTIRLVETRDNSGAASLNMILDSTGRLKNLSVLLRTQFPGQDVRMNRKLFKPRQFIFHIEGQYAGEINRFGVMDFDGKIIIPPVFSEIGSLDPVSKLAPASLYDSERHKATVGYINEQGQFKILLGNNDKF